MCGKHVYPRSTVPHRSTFCVTFDTWKPRREQNKLSLCVPMRVYVDPETATLAALVSTAFHKPRYHQTDLDSSISRSDSYGQGWKPREHDWPKERSDLIGQEKQGALLRPWAAIWLRCVLLLRSLIIEQFATNSISVYVWRVWGIHRADEQPKPKACKSFKPNVLGVSFIFIIIFTSVLQFFPHLFCALLRAK